MNKTQITLNKVMEAVVKLFERKAHLKNDIMTLHMKVYNYLTFGLDSRTKSVVRRCVEKGEDLYSQLTEYLVAYVTRLSLFFRDKNHGAEDILKFYNAEWNDYRSRSIVLDCSFKHLNQNWIERTNNVTESNSVLPIYELTLSIWTDHFVKIFSDQLSNAICQLIERERMSKQMETASLISGLITSYVELDKQNLTIYNTYFVSRFLEESQAFYIREGRLCLEKTTMTEYVSKVNQWIQEEKRRADLCLHQTTREPLLNGCRKILIENNIELFYEEFQELLNFHKIADLERFYHVVSGNANYALPKLYLILEQHIKSNGLSALEQCCETAQNDPKQYVNTLLQVYAKFSVLVSGEFRNDDKFKTALGKAFCSLVNSNAVTKIANASRKSPELIAKYCDALLKTSNNMSESDEPNKSLDKIIILLSYLEDIDAFQMFYSKLFANRLLKRLSTSDDAEIYMISKLKELYGIEYTSKLQKMIQDIGVSKNVSQEFRNHIAKSNEPLGIDISTQILSIGSWPFKPCSPVVLPLECEKIIGKFVDFYLKLHSGRKLHWLFPLSVGELTMNGFKKIYTVIATALQFSILTQYNLSDSWTIGQLTENTSIEMNVVIKIVQILLRTKLVTCAEDKILSRDSVVAINNGYKNKKLRLNISESLNLETKVEQKQTDKQIEMNRRFITQAAIVRIMKSRKTMQHQQLIGEVLNQVNDKFKPKVTLIKNCIDTLIEKEYLERSREHLSTYVYLA